MSLNPAFRVAVIAGAQESVLLHLKRGDDVNARDISGTTPLMLAAYRNRPEIVRLLLSHGADPRLLDHRGRDALSLSKARIGNKCEEILSHIVIEPGESASLGELDKTGNQSLAASEEVSGGKPVGEIEILLDAGSSIDSPDEWEEEHPQSAPTNVDQVRLAAISIRREIDRHVPVMLEAGWENIDAYLPIKCNLDGQGADVISDARKLLLQSARSGYVLESDIRAVCKKRSGNRDPEAERRLSMVISDLGWLIRDMPILRDRIDPFEGLPHEMRAIDEALEFLDILTNGIGKLAGTESYQLSSPADESFEIDTILLHHRAAEFLIFPPSEPIFFWIEGEPSMDEHWFFQFTSVQPS